jgi:hypothetical protein
MPRRSYRRRSVDEERYWDHYYEMREQEQEEEERRRWDEYCEEEQEEAERRARIIPRPPREPRGESWRWEVTFLRRKIDDTDAAVGAAAKVEQVRIMFTALLNFRAFLAATPKFRTAISNKIVEFRNEPKAAELAGLFDQVTEMLSGLVARKDYVA